MAKAFRACKLGFNGKRYVVNAQRVVAEVGTDAALGYQTLRFCDSVESDAVQANGNTITIERGADGWLSARFEGPRAMEIVELFSTSTLPLPTSNVESAKATLTRNWPGFDVVVA